MLKHPNQTERTQLNAKLFVPSSVQCLQPLTNTFNDEGTRGVRTHTAQRTKKDEKRAPKKNHVNETKNLSQTFLSRSKVPSTPRQIFCSSYFAIRNSMKQGKVARRSL